MHVLSCFMLDLSSLEFFAYKMTYVPFLIKIEGQDQMPNWVFFYFHAVKKGQIVNGNNMVSLFLVHYPFFVILSRLKIDDI